MPFFFHPNVSRSCMSVCFFFRSNLLTFLQLSLTPHIRAFPISALPIPSRSRLRYFQKTRFRCRRRSTRTCPLAHALRFSHFLLLSRFFRFWSLPDHLFHCNPPFAQIRAETLALALHAGSALAGFGTDTRFLLFYICL